jgi:hypothetical protein
MKKLSNYVDEDTFFCFVMKNFTTFINKHEYIAMLNNINSFKQDYRVFTQQNKESGNHFIC